MTEANIAYANFQFRAWNDTIRHWDFESFTDSVIKRQLKFLNIIGVAALNSVDLNRVSQVSKKKDVKSIPGFLLKYNIRIATYCALQNRRDNMSYKL